MPCRSNSYALAREEAGQFIPYPYGYPPRSRDISAVLGHGDYVYMPEMGTYS
jgi:hypothetical protein